ncbi:uncharacterized protein LOC131676783 [Topomyia yanbarensis]|uniref:uncharacterized protein LOC131676783 n=1 Tax=Topomyia yanbarensis TaxID=2498891 RepID=UPI00273BA272|nr:uncharacterized protein LOC131676783 [Topomyia yanbarensis]
MQTSIQDLPEEMLVKITSYLDLEDRKSVSRVCLWWSKLAFRQSNVQLEIDVRKSRRDCNCSSKCGCNLDRTYLRVLMASQRHYKHLLFYFGTRQNKTDLMLTILSKFAKSLETLKLISDCSVSVRLDFLRRIVDYCQNLKTLHLQSILFYDNEGEAIRFGVLPKLERLYLRSNLLELTQVDVKTITPNITSLFMRVSYVSKRPVDFVTYFASRLTQLDVCFLTADYFQPFSKLHFPRLEKFSLSSADSLVEEDEYLEEYVDFVQRLGKLKEIKLQYKISTAVLGNLVQFCENLVVLSLYTEDLTDEHFLGLAELKCLKTLRLMKATIVIRQPELCPVLPNVQQLTVDGATIENCHTFNGFLRHSFPALVSLQLFRLCNKQENERCSTLSFYKIILGNLTALERLALDEHGKLLSWYLLATFTALTRLRELRLRFKAMTDRPLMSGQLRRVANTIPVNTLILSFIKIKNREIRKLVYMFPNVRLIEAVGCSPVGLQSVRNILPNCVVRQKHKLRMDEYKKD